MQAGQASADSAAGRKLMEAISCIPQMEGSKFETILNSTMQVSHNQTHIHCVYSREGEGKVTLPSPSIPCLGASPALEGCAFVL